MASTGDCTGDSCPVSNGFFSYQPSQVGSAVLLAGFALLVPYNLYTGFRYRTPLNSSMIVAGLMFEIMGYIGRLLLVNDSASQSYFAVYMIGVIWGPTLLSTSIFLLLSHLMTLYGHEFSLLHRPLYLDVFFLVYGMFTLFFQAVGAAFAANAASQAEMEQGTTILLAGLAMQLGSLALFYVIYHHFYSRLSHRRYVLNPTHSEVYMSSRFKIFFILIQIAGMLFLLRTVIRTVQVSNGLGSPLAQSEAISLVLDGGAVLAGSIILSIIPAGAAFGSAWEDTSPFRKTHEADATMSPQRYGAPTDPNTQWINTSSPYHASTPWAPPSAMYFPPPPTAPPRYSRRTSSRTPRLQTPLPLYPRLPYEMAPQPVPFVLPPPPNSYSPSRSSPRQTTSLVGDDVLW